MTKCGNGCDEALGKCFSGRHVCRVVVVVEEEEQEQKKEKEGEEEEENKEKEEGAFKNKTTCNSISPFSEFSCFPGKCAPFSG